MCLLCLGYSVFFALRACIDKGAALVRGLPCFPMLLHVFHVVNR